MASQTQRRRRRRRIRRRKEQSGHTAGLEIESAFAETHKLLMSVLGPKSNGNQNGDKRFDSTEERESEDTEV